MKLSSEDKELLGRVSEVLYHQWDPIGGAGEHLPRDEYESYVPQVFRLLKGSVDGKDVAEYLHWVATERMGLGANRKHDEEVVEVLLGWRDRHSGQPT